MGVPSNVVDWRAAFLNPSFPYRAAHVLLAYSGYSYFVFRGKVAPEPEEVSADTALPESL